MFLFIFFFIISCLKANEKIYTDSFSIYNGEKEIFMKKYFLFLLVLFLLSPTLVMASRYDLEGTDLSILLNDEDWVHFTRENIKDNEKLEELGITYEYLKEFMESNFIYLDAVKFSENDDDTIELFVRKKEKVQMDNLSRYPKKEKELLKEELKKKQNAPISEIYENNYSFVYLEYQDNSYQVLEYYTIMNHDAYTITVQKKNEFTSDEKKEITKMIDHIIFDDQTTETNDFKDLEYIIIGAVTGGIVGFLVSLQNRKEKSTDSKKTHFK